MLQKNEANYYIPVGINYGKIAINNRENEIFTSDRAFKKEIIKIQDNAVIKYKFGEK